MGFADDIEQHMAARQRSEADSAAAMRRADDHFSRLKRQFIGRFQEATDYLRSEGVLERRVVAIQRGSLGFVNLERVYPYSAIDIGTWFLHDGELHRGYEETAGVSSLLRRVRKHDWIINAKELSVSQRLKLAPDNGYSRPGLSPGDLCVVEEYDGESYYNADQWLLEKTEIRLQRARERRNMRSG